MGGRVTDRELRQQLTERAARHDLSSSDAVIDALVAYFQLLTTWNRKINLAGFNLDDPADVGQAIDRILLEPLAASKFVPAGSTRLIDIGSGGGSPAIPLALARPMVVLMVESRARKAAFLAEAIRALGLKHATVEVRRFEELLPRAELSESHDLVTVRAVRVEPKTLMSLQTFIRPGGQAFLFTSERALAIDVPPPLVAIATHRLLVASSSLIQIVAKVAAVD